MMSGRECWKFYFTVLPQISRHCFNIKTIFPGLGISIITGVNILYIETALSLLAYLGPDSSWRLANVNLMSGLLLVNVIYLRWTIVLTHWGLDKTFNILMTFQWNWNIFFQENVFKNVVCRVSAILFRPQCVKWNRIPEHKRVINYCCFRILVSGICFTNVESCKIQTIFCIIQMLYMHVWSAPNFAHAPTAVLSLHVQNLVVMWLLIVLKKNSKFVKKKKKPFVKQAPGDCDNTDN